MTTQVALTGRHVRLEPLSPAHAEPLFRAAQGHGARFSFTFVPQTLEAAHAYVETAQTMHRENGALAYATVRLEDETVVGSTRLAMLEYWQWPAGTPERRPPGVPDAVEIGWTWLTPGAQRTALNTEAKLLMLTHAFETWQVERVTLKTDERNRQSRANIERVGAKLDGVLRGHMPAADGGVRASAVFSILAAEWPTVKAGLRAKLSR